MLWFVFVFFRLVPEERISKAFMLYQAKPRFCMELMDSKVSAQKNTFKKKENIRIYS
jgi:hypothetical protein